MTKTIHVLKHGISYCNMPGVPGEWPREHFWVSFEDALNANAVNCPECIAVRNRADNPTSEGTP